MKRWGLFDAYVKGYFYNVSNTPVSGVTDLSFDVYYVNGELVDESTAEHEFKYDYFYKVKLEDGIKTYYNNKKINFSKTKPKIENGSTLVPLRFIGETFGAQIFWGQDSKIIIIAE